VPGSPMPRDSDGSGSVTEGSASTAGPRGRSTPSILHVDMDAFFASVEVLDHPELAGKPVIVGGSGARGVVASCSYEARAFGVHSAMPSVRARQLCPDAVFIDGHYSRYAEVSASLRELLLGVTPLVEPIGLDEAFLDVDGAIRLFGPPATIGASIKHAVREQLDLDCGVGAGRSKLIAKLASRAAKPRAGPGGKTPGPGVVVVEAEEETGFLHPMPVERLWGVGPATARQLHDLGIRTVGDLAAVPLEVLVRRLGRAHGTHLSSLARGDDDDPVVPDRPTKSVGHEETFSHDIASRGDLRRHLVRMSESVAGHLRKSEQAGRTVTVKVKYGDFSVATRSHTMAFALDTGRSIAAIADALLDAVDLGAGVRLLGVSVSGLAPAATGRQLRFALGTSPDAPAPAHAGTGASGDMGGQSPTRRAGAAEAGRRQESWAEVMAAVDAIRQRFGTAAVGAASMVGATGIVVPARRDAPWGPPADAAEDPRAPGS
jgi:DNA polymerase IV